VWVLIDAAGGAHWFHAKAGLFAIRVLPMALQKMQYDFSDAQAARTEKKEIEIGRLARRPSLFLLARKSENSLRELSKYASGQSCSTIA
jgi:hypothetical protein